MSRSFPPLNGLPVVTGCTNILRFLARARSQMELLYFGPYRMIRAALPYMRKRRFGVIVNISSGAGLEGRDSMGVYAAAKAAMDGKLTHSHLDWKAVLWAKW